MNHTELSMTINASTCKVMLEEIEKIAWEEGYMFTEEGKMVEIPRTRRRGVRIRK